MTDLVDAGGKCPCCGEALDVEGGGFDVEGEEAWQRVTCLKCGCRYAEVYRYAGAEVIDEGELPPPGKERRDDR